MSLRSAAALAAVCLAAMSLAGCKSSSTTTGPAANPAATSAAAGGTTTSAATAASASVDVCSLLTPAQASAIVGYTYTTATPSTGQCSYATTTAPIPMFIIVSTGSWSQESATLQADGSGGPLVPIAGVGDKAAGADVEIGVQSGKWIIDIHGGDPDGTGAAFPKSVALAKAIIAKLS